MSEMQEYSLIQQIEWWNVYCWLFLLNHLYLLQVSYYQEL